MKEKQSETTATLEKSRTPLQITQHVLLAIHEIQEPLQSRVYSGGGILNIISYTLISTGSNISEDNHNYTLNTTEENGNVKVQGMKLTPYSLNKNIRDYL